MTITLLCFPLPTMAAPLVADLSNYRIHMDSGFNGTRMFLFGARNEGGDIVVVVRGPIKDFVVRKKEEFGGIWINRERVRFWDVPDFYAVAASKPLSEIGQSAVLRLLGVGEKNVLTPPSNPAEASRFEDFSAAFLRHQVGRGLYTEQAGNVQFMGETLFKTTIEFPDTIPPGAYTAEIYLVSDGEVVGMQSTPITVVKTGLDAFLFNYAHGSPALYGITAIVMALAAGWFAGRLFEKT